ncbi:MAG TPA: hypothetical protein VH877_03565 [Polyangia bacterium]|nr:hypothetical protein [Polyangia bacterium]
MLGPSRTTAALRLGGLALTLMTLGACRVDPCAEQTGACLVVEVRGSVGNLTGLRVRLDGTTAAQRDLYYPTSHSLPIRIGVIPPTTSGAATVRAAGFRQNQTVGYGRTDITLTSALRATVVVTLSPSAGDCADGIQDGDESDRDCGGSCPAACPAALADPDRDAPLDIVTDNDNDALPDTSY